MNTHTSQSVFQARAQARGLVQHGTLALLLSLLPLPAYSQGESNSLDAINTSAEEASLASSVAATGDNTNTQNTLPLQIDDYEAVYQGRVKGLNIQMHRTLSKNGDRISLGMRANKLIFSIKEHSELTLDGDVMRSISYAHKRRNLGDRHDRELSFDWNKEPDGTEFGHIIDALRPEQAAFKVPYPCYDKMSYQDQFRIDLLAAPNTTRLEYCVSDGQGMKVYAFDFQGEETLSTPLGEIVTKKFKRDRGENAIRQTYVWFAPQWNYLLVRLDQIEGLGEKPETLLLKKATVAGKAVSTGQ